MSNIMNQDPKTNLYESLLTPDPIKINHATDPLLPSLSNTAPAPAPKPKKTCASAIKGACGIQGGRRRSRRSRRRSQRRKSSRRRR